MKSRVLLPIYLAFAFVIGLTIFASGWTWSLYDELRWIGEYLREGRSVMNYIRTDFADSRVRPFSEIVVFSKYKTLGFDPKLFRIERAVEVFLTAIAALAFLTKRERLPVIAAALGVGFWLKSPPQLEQLRWSTLSELTGIFFVLLGLWVRPRSRVLGHLVSIPGYFAKEPLPVFAVLAPLLERKFKEAIGVGVLVFSFLLALYLNRKGYSAGYGKSLKPGALPEILRMMMIDFAPLVPLIVAVRASDFKRESLWKAAVFLAVGGSYLVMVIPMAWGYTYILAPVVFCVSMALAYLLADVYSRPNLKKWVHVFGIFLVVLFSARICWNWTKVYRAMTVRHEMFSYIATLPKTSLIGSNCLSDGKSIGFAADTLVGPPENARADGPSCGFSGQTFSDCCVGADYVAVGDECSFYSERTEQAQALKADVVFQNRSWAVYRCPLPKKIGH